MDKRGLARCITVARYDHDQQAFHEPGHEPAHTLLPPFEQAKTTMIQKRPDLLHEVLDNQRSQCMLLDENLKVVHINPGGRMELHILANTLGTYLPGFDPDHLEGANLQHLLKPHILQQLQQALQHHQVIEGEVTLGSHILVYKISALGGSADKPAGYLVNWFDVTTQRQRAEQERFLQGFTRAASDGARRGILFTDLAGQITYANPVAITLLMQGPAAQAATHPESLVGRPLTTLFPHDLPGPELLQHQSPWRGELRYGKHDLSLEIQAVEDEQHKQLGWLIYCDDLTEEKRAMAAIRSLIQQAGKGDWHGRLDLDHFHGFLRHLAEDVNELLDAITGPLIGGPLATMAAHIERLAAGEIPPRLDGDYQGDFAIIQNSLNTLIATITSIVEAITNASQTIVQATFEITVGHQDLALRTQRQAAALEDLLKTMEELAQTTGQAAERAGETSDAAGLMRDQAISGSALANQTVAVMREIAQQGSRSITYSSIVDELALRSNILAFNAAIEAAHAGAAGGGFAVVAREMRLLSGRSAAAAREIKRLLQESNQKIARGDAWVRRTSCSFQSITATINQVTDLIIEIATGAEGQWQRINLSKQDIAHLNTLAQQNAALVEQTSAASASLNQQAQQLRELLSFFRIDGH